MVADEARGNVVFGGDLQAFPEADLGDEHELGRGSLRSFASVFAAKVRPSGYTDVGVFDVWAGWGFRKPICQCNDDCQMVGSEGSQWLPGGTHC